MDTWVPILTGVVLLGLLAGRLVLGRAFVALRQTQRKLSAVQQQFETARKRDQQKFQERLQKLREDAKGRADALRKELTETRASLEKMRAEISGATRLERRVAEVEKRAQGGRAELSADAVGELIEQWCPRLHLRLTRAQISYLGDVICAVDPLLIGRSEIGLRDFLLSVLICGSIEVTPAVVLETRAKLGRQLILLNRLCGPFRPQLCLFGLHKKDYPDPATGIPVTLGNFESNLNYAGVTRENIALISSIPELGNSIQYLIVDGCGSYEEIRAVFEECYPSVAPGGTVHFREYANTAVWPDATRFVDEEIIGRKDLELLGASWHSAVFRKKAP